MCDTTPHGKAAHAERARARCDPLWRDVAALIWRNGTQGFPTETRKIWHALERPPPSRPKTSSGSTASRVRNRKDFHHLEGGD